MVGLADAGVALAGPVGVGDGGRGRRGGAGQLGFSVERADGGEGVPGDQQAADGGGSGEKAAHLHF